MSDIFLSYANVDHDKLFPLVRILENQGWSVFWDSHIVIGKDWRDTIEKELNDCSCVIVIWTIASVKSQWVIDEAEVGKERGILYPIIFDGVAPPLGFRGVQSVTANWQDINEHFSFKTLIQELNYSVNTQNNFAEKQTDYKKIINNIIRLFLLVPVAFFLIYLMFFYFFLSGGVDKYNQSFLLKLHEYRTAVSVRDGKGSLLGIISNGVSPPNSYIDRNEEGKYLKSYNRNGSIYVEKVPDFFWEILIESEHKQLNFHDEDGFLGYIKGVTRRSYRGVDILSPLFHVFSRNGIGGSTLMNTLIKELYGPKYFSIKKNRIRECPLIINLNSVFCHKWVEYRGARDLFPLLADNNGLEFKRWVSMHSDLVGAVGGGGLYGLQAASAIMFNKKPQYLNLAEQSILALSFAKQYRFSTPKFIRLKRWENKKALAFMFSKRALEKKYSGEELLSKKKLLEDQFISLKQPKLPSKVDLSSVNMSIAEFFIDDPVDTREFQKNSIINHTNLKLRINSFTPGFKYLLKNDLNSYRKNNLKVNPTEIVITLPPQSNIKFKSEISKNLDNLSKFFKFNKSLNAKSNLNERASIRISVASFKDGNIIRYYLQEGKYAVEEKVSLLLPIRPTKKLFELISRALVPFNTSADASYIYKKIPVKKVNFDEFFKYFGFTLRKIGINDRLSSDEIINKSAKSTAANTHKIMHKLAQIIELGDVKTSLKSIKSIKSYDTYKVFILDESIENNSVIKQYLTNKDYLNYIKNIFSTFKNSSEELHFLTSIKHGKIIYAITDTSYINNNIKDKYLVGLLDVKGSLYTFSVLVGSELLSKKENGLIKYIETKELMLPLVQTIIDSIYYE